jgi:hypothetical protein
VKSAIRHGRNLFTGAYTLFKSPRLFKLSFVVQIHHDVRRL